MEPARTSSPSDDTIDVPETALVQCPLAGFDLRPVAACLDCPKFAGLEDRFPGMEKMAFAKRYTVKCYGEPVKRPMLSIAKG